MISNKTLFNISKFLLLSLFLVLAITTITKHEAHAYYMRPDLELPSDFQFKLQSYDNPANLGSTCQPPGNQEEFVNSWISPVNNPNVDATTLTLFPGQTINLQINTVIFLCYRVSIVTGPLYNAILPLDGTRDTSNVNGNLFGNIDIFGGINPVNNVDPTSPGTISNFSPTTIQYTDNGSRYWFGQPVTFTYTAPNVSQPTNITLNANVISANIFQKNNGKGKPKTLLYQCVVNGGYSSAKVSDVAGNCKPFFPAPNFILKVLQPIKIINLSYTCVPTTANGEPVNGETVNGQVEFGSNPDPGAVIDYKVDGSTPPGSPVTSDGLGNFSVDMSSFDQLRSHNVDLTPASGLTSSIAYGSPKPCYAPACNGPPSINAPGNLGGPILNQPFFVVASPKFINKTSGSPGNPVVGGSAIITFDGQAPKSVSSPPYQAQFTESTPGVYTYSYTYKDGAVTIAPPACPNSTVTIGYNPYFVVQGGDVSTGSGGFSNNCNPSNKSGILAFNLGAATYRGASSNLAAFAPNVINGFVTSNGDNSYSLSTPTGLTFANNSPPFGGNLGSQGKTDCSSDYYGSAGAEANSPAITLGSDTFDLNSLPACKLTDGINYCWVKPLFGNSFVNITKSGGNFNGHVVLYVEGDAVIKNNIILDQNYAGGVASIPNFYLVVSGNIFVDDGVSTMDGVYIAQPNANANAGVITTCSNGYTKYDFSNLYDSCSGASEQLTIDGAVIARQIKLNRTFGDIQTANSAAEIFKYNPNTWIVNPFTAGSTTSSNPTYAGISFLPPVL